MNIRALRSWVALSLMMLAACSDGSTSDSSGDASADAALDALVDFGSLDGASRGDALLEAEPDSDVMLDASLPRDAAPDAPAPACSNGVDDDGDGLRDDADPGCASPADESELGTGVCDDGADNDEDGLADAADPGCTSAFDDSERGTAQCDDALDSDDDGLIDMDDPGCESPADASELGMLACDDGVDNDADGFIDAHGEFGDPGCTSPSDASESDASRPCDDGMDNDGDTLIDALDPGCASVDDASERSAAPCDDGEDNDNDHLVDLLDPGCVSVYDESELGGACDNGLDDDMDGRSDLLDPGCTSTSDESELGTAACDDGMDNDGDGLTDARAAHGDPGCSGLTDTSELGTTACDDGADNDGDGETDLDDFGCTSPTDTSELGTTACDDGVDNDGDGLADSADPGCVDGADDDEHASPSAGVQCDDGVDNDGDGDADMNDVGCDSPADTNEHSDDYVCDDGIDNDGDGDADLEDIGCESATDTSERGATVCDDGVDNDQDGLSDNRDPGCFGPSDTSEHSSALVCDDGLDNDSDGFIDFSLLSSRDLGCGSLLDVSERGIAELDAGHGGHVCARFDDGKVKCWGRNDVGQLGLGDTLPRGNALDRMGDALPYVQLGTGRHATALAVGGYHTCALLDTGTVKCWGRNDSGQLGYGDTTRRGDNSGEMGDSLTTVDLGSSRSARAIAAGTSFTCALLDDSSIKCWGSNGSGQLGITSATTRGDEAGEMGNALPIVVLGGTHTAKRIAAGDSHVCAILEDDSLKCWGANSYGQLGLGDTTSRADAMSIAVQLGTSRYATLLALGTSHTCVVLDDASVKCWGGNAQGQLGQGSTTSYGNSPSNVPSMMSAVDLGASRSAIALRSGGSHVCALRDDQSLVCWGYNASGQLGLGDMGNRGDSGSEMGAGLRSPGTRAGIAVRGVTAGDLHSCAVLEDDSIQCWGDNASGQLGLGDTLTRGDGPNEMLEFLGLVNLGDH